MDSTANEHLVVGHLCQVVDALHIITGPNGMCMCGRDGMTCGQILAMHSKEIQDARIMAEMKQRFGAEWVGADAVKSEGDPEERGNAFAAAPCYAPLRWSAEKPAAAGWWWVKARGHAAQIREFEIELNPMCAEDHPIQPVGGPLSTEGWKWFAGPLPEPLEDSIVEPEHNIRISDTV